MDKCIYEKLVEDCNSWFDQQNKYIQERIQTIRKWKDDEIEQEKQLNELKEKYKADWNFYFGPWIEILDKEDLIDKNFILPGHSCCFLDMDWRNPQEILDCFGKKIVNCDGEMVGIVVGYGYDMRDDYLITIDSSGKKRTVMLNEKYTVI